MNVCILKIHVYVQVLLDVILNFIKQFNFFEELVYFDGINLSEKCVIDWLIEDILQAPSTMSDDLRA